MSEINANVNVIKIFHTENLKGKFLNLNYINLNFYFILLTYLKELQSLVLIKKVFKRKKELWEILTSEKLGMQISSLTY